ncbi:unnamed protein product [Mytilus edulis]|uniref:Uncharacterized protein n=1 Tax=Mytilus edulis TaxID=6550 RepID=A0A8S3T9V2_MYTED|nr:unnamed protein product [Mytilus edulis]
MTTPSQSHSTNIDNQSTESSHKSCSNVINRSGQQCFMPAEETPSQQVVSTPSRGNPNTGTFSNELGGQGLSPTSFGLKSVKVSTWPSRKIWKSDLDQKEKKEARHERNTEFADANETSEEHRANVYAHGEGDVNREYGMSGQRGQRGINTDGFRYNNPHTVSIRPEPYNGEEDWEEYISHFEVCAELGRWMDADKVLALAAALRGPVKTFYISLEQTAKGDYGILNQRLGLRFESTRQQNRWPEMRKRKPMRSNSGKVLELNQLYTRVTPEVKYQCTNQGCRTVAGAVEVIERYEALIGDGSEKKKGSVRMTTDTHLEEESNFQLGTSGKPISR